MECVRGEGKLVCAEEGVFGIVAGYGWLWLAMADGASLLPQAGAYTLGSGHSARIALCACSSVQAEARVSLGTTPSATAGIARDGLVTAARSLRVAPMVSSWTAVAQAVLVRAHSPFFASCLHIHLLSACRLCTLLKGMSVE